MNEWMTWEVSNSGLSDFKATTAANCKALDGCCERGEQPSHFNHVSIGPFVGEKFY